MRRALVALLVVALAATGVFFGVRAAWHAITDRVGSGCSFATFDTSTDQAATASTMVGVVVRRGLPRRAAVLVLAAALQESKLRNIPPGQGDRDSVGVLQQRPSQGWGSATELTDVRFATGAFLDKLIAVPSWRTEDLATVVQAVQISANGDLYARHEPQAEALAQALSGATPRGVTCHFPAPTRVATGSVLAAEMRRDLGGAAPEVRGRTVTVPGGRWTTAAWLVANADRLGVDSVSYAAGRWSRTHGWRDDASASSSAVVAILAA